MPEIEGMTFPDYIHVDWPMFVTRLTDGVTELVLDETERDAFLEPDRLAAKAKADEEDVAEKVIADAKAAAEYSAVLANMPSPALKG